MMPRIISTRNARTIVNRVVIITVRTTVQVTIITDVKKAQILIGLVEDTNNNVWSESLTGYLANLLLARF